MIKQPEIVSVRLTEVEAMFLDSVCAKHGLNRHEFLRSIVIDALLDEGYDALRCGKPEGRSTSGEASETCGATTP